MPVTRSLQYKKDDGTIEEVELGVYADNVNQDASHRFVTDSEKSTWNNKVDKVDGKGLSTNDYTTAEKNKLAGIAAGATKNTASSAAPKIAGTAAAGTSNDYSRADHVHPAQTSVSGNSGTATKLATARTINRVAFDGTQNITVTADPTTTTLTNQNLNDQFNPGFYNAGGGNTVTNKPTGTDAFGMIIMKNASGYTCQIIIESGNKMWMRTCTSTTDKTWGAWQPIYNQASPQPTVAKATADASGNTITTSYVASATISGKTITLKSKSGATLATLTTQDTTYSNATTSTAGLMSSADKAKLDGVAANANNYTHPSTHAASMITQDSTHRFVTDTEKTNWNNKYTKSEIDNKFSTLETNIDWKESVDTFEKISTTYPNPVDGWTVNVKDTDYTYRYNGTTWVAISANAIPNATSSVAGLMTAADKSKLDGISAGSNNYVHPTTSGYKHIPSGGSSGQFLKWSSDGTAVWAADNNTTYNVATTTANGLMSSADKTKLDGVATGANNYVHPTTAGNKHIPSGGSAGLFLKWSSDGTATWAADNNTTYSTATTTVAGLLSPEDKTKLNSISQGANAYVHPTTSGNKHIPSGGASGQILRWSADGTATWGADNNTTYSVATQSANGLMSAADKKKLDGVATGAAARRIAMVGSNTANTSGWYKFADQTFSNQVNSNIIFAVTSTYGNYFSGILSVQLRSDTDTLTCESLKWQTRLGFAVGDVICNISGMKATLYANQKLAQWGRLVFEVISESTYNTSTSGMVLYNNTTKEASTPSATVTASDGATVSYANSAGSATKTTGDASGNTITTSYAASLAVSGKTVTLKSKSGATLSTITTQDTTYADATTSAHGLMTAAMVTKLNGIATGANAYTHPTTAGNKHIPSGGSSGQFLKWSADGTAVWAADNNTTYSVATSSANGLMSAADKAKLDGIAAGSNAYTHPTSSGYKHIPSGGAAGQFLKWSSDGTAVWAADNNTTYGLATASANGLLAAGDFTKLSKVTATEMDYLHGVTSDVQTQLNGKAASSHGTHVPSVCTTITDWNAATSNGWYMASGATNAPTSGSTWYFGTVVVHNTNYLVQEVYQFTTSSDAYAIPKYLRARTNGTWGAWRNVTVATTVPSGAKFTDTVYTHPTSSGYKHIPAGGSSGQILRWSADGTAAWGADNNTTYSVATQSVNGLMSAADKKKLDGIATGANAYTHPTGAGNNHIPAGGSSGQFLKWSSSGVAVWAADNNTTYGVATTSANGLMAAADKSKLNGIGRSTGSYTLAAASWSGSGPYTYALSVSGVTTSNDVFVSLGSGATADQANQWANAKVMSATQASGSITLKAFGVKPTAAIPLQVSVITI